MIIRTFHLQPSRLAMLLSISIFSLFLSTCYVQSKRFFIPSPLPRFPDMLENPVVATDLNILPKEEIYGYAWERSGLFEGDIVLSGLKNSLSDPSKKWSLPIPVYVNGSDFDKSELAVIEKALTEIEKKTCVRFRQYRLNDPAFIVVRGHDKGCWSVVGRKDGGQILHLQRPQCVHHGIVIHEFLHALGLFHQQSSPDRDSFIEIHWANIQRGREHNFLKYSENTVTTFNLTYDYNSLMHYSYKAFSSNGEPTITPLDPDAHIGQRKKMSDLDTAKVRYLYNCSIEENAIQAESKEDFYDFSLEQLEDMLFT